MKKERILIWLILSFTSLSVIIGVVIVTSKLPQRKKLVVEKRILGKTVPFPKKNYIGLVRIYGAINDEATFGPWSSSYVERVIKQLENYAVDRRVKGVIIRINSPGGTVASAQEIFRSIMRIRKKWGIPVVACLGDVAASGGYYVAAADHIVANPGTITGSIGVIMGNVEISELLQKIGIKTNVIKEGKFKDIGSLFRQMTPEEEELLKNSVKEVYRQMLFDITQARANLSYEEFKQIADGRIFTGEKAKELGLVDSLGGMEEAIQIIMEKANLKEKPIILEYPGVNWETILGMFSYYFRKNFLPGIDFKERLSQYLEKLELQ